MIDLKLKKFLEQVRNLKKYKLKKRSLYDVLSEVFGSGISVGWFFPFKIGGYLPRFKKLHNKPKHD